MIERRNKTNVSGENKHNREVNGHYSFIHTYPPPSSSFNWMDPLTAGRFGKNCLLLTSSERVHFFVHKLKAIPVIQGYIWQESPKSCHKICTIPVGVKSKHSLSISQTREDSVISGTGRVVRMFICVQRISDH